jgi:hypothetical protein
LVGVCIHVEFLKLEFLGPVQCTESQDAASGSGSGHTGAAKCQESDLLNAKIG